MDLAQLTHSLVVASRRLEQQFLNKSELIRLMLISIVAGEHLLLVGPPGTAKSALIRAMARLLDAKYFEYLLTRFTEPNELFGPVDIKAFREGSYVRKIDGMLPEAEIVFLDEIFKSNSAILNSLLTILNERRFFSGARAVDVPLVSLFAASNEVPNDDHLAAVFDRFLIRCVSDNLDSYYFNGLVERGIANEIAALTTNRKPEPALLSTKDVRSLHARFAEHLKFSEPFVAQYKGLIFQIRSEGISVSDRRVVKLLKLFAASAVVDGRSEANESDFFILKHVWNNHEQIELLREIVDPVVERYYRDHPKERRVFAGQAGLEDLLKELKLIRELFADRESLSDVQLFSQLKNLNEIKSALGKMDSDTAKRMVKEIDQLLQTVLGSSKFD